MTDSQYIEVPQSWAENHKWYARGDNRFNYAITKDGRAVCDPNSMDEFKDLFDELKDSGWVPVIETLYSTDFN